MPCVKKTFFGGRPRQEILKIEICTWNKNKTDFLMFMKLPIEVPNIIKKIFPKKRLYFVKQINNCQPILKIVGTPLDNSIYFI